MSYNPDQDVNEQFTQYSQELQAQSDEIQSLLRVWKKVAAQARKKQACFDSQPSPYAVIYPVNYPYDPKQTTHEQATQYSTELQKQSDELQSWHRTSQNLKRQIEQKQASLDSQPSPYALIYKYKMPKNSSNI